MLYPESMAHSGQPVDDSSSIQDAFELCGTNGSVTFTEGTFHVNKVLTTTNLLNCNVNVRGDIVYSTNVPYWLSHSINVGLQNQSTAWLFGGTNVVLDGAGGSINGNGQTWYSELFPSLKHHPLVASIIVIVMLRRTQTNPDPQLKMPTIQISLEDPSASPSPIHRIFWSRICRSSNLSSGPHSSLAAEM